MSGFLDSISSSISEAPYIIKCLTVFLLSMIPVTELRLALPFGIVIGLDYPSAMLFSFLGNIAVIPPVVVWGGKLIRYFAKFEKLGKPFFRVPAHGQAVSFPSHFQKSCVRCGNPWCSVFSPQWRLWVP